MFFHRNLWSGLLVRICIKRAENALSFALVYSALLSAQIHAEQSHLTAEDLAEAHAPMSDQEKVSSGLKAIDIPPGYLNNLKWDIPLPDRTENGCKVEWRSGNPEYLSHDGKLLKRSPRGQPQVTVKYGVRLTSGDVSQTKIFDVRIAPEEPEYDGYLFAYFEGSGDRMRQEQLRFGVSADARNWVALNKNQPVIESSKISKTGGIRDPHILRGEDGKTFYTVATDMFTHKNGWGANPGIVMLKSDDLINWEHAYVDFAKEYPERFGNVHWVWAPQTVYDPAEGHYMVYFTIRHKGMNNLDFYRAYANDDFTGFISEPTLMFRAKYGAIDGDIVYRDGLYHLFYKGNTKDENGHEFENGIQQATSKTLEGPWIEDFVYLDYYAGKKTVVEGSSVFKLNDEDSYILMYDLYSNLRYEFQRSDDLFNFTKQPEAFTKNFNPRHGSVIGSISHWSRPRIALHPTITGHASIQPLSLTRMAKRGFSGAMAFAITPSSRRT